MRLRDDLEVAVAHELVEVGGAATSSRKSAG